VAELAMSETVVLRWKLRRFGRARRRIYVRYGILAKNASTKEDEAAAAACRVSIEAMHHPNPKGLTANVSPLARSSPRGCSTSGSSRCTV
jgi:hypothetical protein